jgi:hypothetical protein
MHALFSMTGLTINTGRGRGTVGGSMNSSEGDTKETLVVDHNKGVEMGISERESISMVNRSGSIQGID